MEHGSLQPTIPHLAVDIGASSPEYDSCNQLSVGDSRELAAVGPLAASCLRCCLNPDCGRPVAVNIISASDASGECGVGTGRPRSRSCLARGGRSRAQSVGTRTCGAASLRGWACASPSTSESALGRYKALSLRRVESRVAHLPDGSLEEASHIRWDAKSDQVGRLPLGRLQAFGEVRAVASFPSA